MRSIAYGLGAAWAATLAFRLIVDPAYGGVVDWTSIGLLWALSLGLVVIGVVQVAAYVRRRTAVKRAGGSFVTTTAVKRFLVAGLILGAIFRVYTFDYGQPWNVIGSVLLSVFTVTLIAFFIWQKQRSRSARSSSSSSAGG